MDRNGIIADAARAARRAIAASVHDCRRAFKATPACPSKPPIQTFHKARENYYRISGTDFIPHCMKPSRSVSVPGESAPDDTSHKYNPTHLYTFDFLKD